MRASAAGEALAGRLSLPRLRPRSRLGARPRRRADRMHAVPQADLGDRRDDDASQPSAAEGVVHGRLAGGARPTDRRLGLPRDISCRGNRCLTSNAPVAGMNRRLCTKIGSANRNAIADCYADQAYFEDVAFRLDGKERILKMRQLVCPARPNVTILACSADDHAGRSSWTRSTRFAELLPDLDGRLTTLSTRSLPSGKAVSINTTTDVSPWSGLNGPIVLPSAISQAQSDPSDGTRRLGSSYKVGDSQRVRTSRWTDSTDLALRWRLASTALPRK